MCTLETKKRCSLLTLYIPIAFAVMFSGSDHGLYSFSTRSRIQIIYIYICVCVCVCVCVCARAPYRPTMNYLNSKVIYYYI